MSQRPSISSPPIRSTSKKDKKEKASFIEKLSNRIPVLYVCLLSVAVVNEFIYYFFFGINITDYLVLSDFVNLLFDDIILIVGATIFFLVATRHFFPILGIYDEISKAKPKYQLIIYFAFILSIMAILFFSMEYLVFSSALKIFSLISFFLFTTLFIYQSVAKRPELDFVGTVIWLIFIIASYSAFRAAMKMDDIQFNKSKLSEIEFKSSEKWTADSTLHVIGTSSNYLFLYNKADSSTSILNRNNIKSLKLDRRKNDKRNFQFLYLRD